MTRYDISPRNINCDPADLALVLGEFQDFVWLESRGRESASIMAFAAREHKVFFRDDQEAFKNFLSSVWCASSSQTKNKLLFDGGWIGGFCYEAYLFNEQIPFGPTHLPDGPLATFSYYDTFILCENGTPLFYSFSDDADKTYADLLRRLALLGAELKSKPTHSPGRAVPHNTSEKKYRDNFSAVRERIFNGGYFELNLSFEHLLPFEHNPIDLFLKLREKLPAPMMAYLRRPGESVLSASPERFFSVKQGVIKTTPIKGTRPRAALNLEDLALREELFASAKDRAELLMVTDMLRNDLGRVCIPGGVRVQNVCRVQTFSHYHHLMSDIEGDLKKETTFFDLFTALFPGGSITGAPKVEVMRDIDKLEARARGIYTGAIGYIADNGNLDFNIPIRTAVVKDKMVSFAVGSGIVADSKCDAEYEECHVKAKGFFEALESFVPVLVMVFTLLFAACGDTTDDVATTESDNMILISSYSFSPLSLTIAEGGSVVFYNQDAVSHWIKSESAPLAFDDTGVIDSIIIEPGTAREITLPDTAVSGTTIYYYDEILKEIMVTPDGEIVVE